MRVLWAGIAVVLLLLLLPSCGTSTHGVELHGSMLVRTKVFPSGQELREGKENTVVEHPDLGFVVTIENTGDVPEEHVNVTLAIQVSPKPIAQTKSIDRLDSRERTSVLFRDLGQLEFARMVMLNVDIRAVPGETNSWGNSARYPVVFSID